MFSIIVPLYNKGVLIRRSLDSILQQSYLNYEVIIVDDGSKDNSASFVKEYSDSRIKYIYKDNGGVSSARNLGIQNASFDWIVFLDADDQLLPEALSLFNKLISRYTDCKLFVGNNITIKDNNKENVFERKCDIDKNTSKTVKTHIPFYKLWSHQFYAAPRNVAIHKSVIYKYGAFNTSMSFYEDYEFSLRMLQHKPFVYTNIPVSIYYQDGEGLSASRHPIEKEMAYFIPEIIKTQHPNLWYKALLYENIEMEILWWQQHGNEEHVKFYQDMQKKYFSRVYSVLHWLRQKMIRRGII